MKKFKRIFIEISNMCNLACSFCPPSKRNKRAMSLCEFETVLQKIEGHGDHIYLHVKGEPLIHKEFKRILNLCAEYSKKVNITTNGTLLDRQGADILENSAVRLVNISLQSYEETNDEKAYTDYLDKVLAFVKRGLEETTKLFELRLWNLDAHQMNTGRRQHSTLDYIRSYLEIDIPVTEQNTKGLNGQSRVYISKGFEFQWPSLENEIVSETGRCYGLRHQVAILSSGQVVPCCMDSEGVIALGNIFEENFQAIVDSSRAKAIRTGFENEKLIEPLCKRCGYRNAFVKK